MAISPVFAPSEGVPVAVPTGLGAAAAPVAVALNVLLADVFALYLKTKNFHWHVGGPHFFDYHGLLDEQAGELIGITDAIAERVRKLGAATLRSVGHVARLQRVIDNDADHVPAASMLAELHADNRELVARMRALHGLCAGAGDVATAGLLESWIDEGERRAWFLAETTRHAPSA